jgi:hypothetical protein
MIKDNLEVKEMNVLEIIINMNNEIKEIEWNFR